MSAAAGGVRGGDLARLVALAMIWSMSFVFFRVLVPSLGAVPTATMRVLIAGVALVAWLAATGQRADLRRHWRAYLFMGVVNSAIPFLLFAHAAYTLPASVMAILNASTPLFTSLIAAHWLGRAARRAQARRHRIRRRGRGAGDRRGRDRFPGGVARRRRVPGRDAVLRHLGRVAQAPRQRALALRGGGLEPASRRAGAAARGRVRPARRADHAAVVANLLGLALLCSAVAYLMYYRLIRDIGPTRTMTVTFLIPVFGIAWGALLLGERITWPVVAGTLLIVGGTAAVLVRRPAPG